LGYAVLFRFPWPTDWLAKQRGMQPRGRAAFHLS